ncbi:MAG TPA: PaaI family thioesterase [Rudaea sp.]
MPYSALTRRVCTRKFAKKRHDACVASICLVRGRSNVSIAMDNEFVPDSAHFSALERLYATAPANAYWQPTLTVSLGRAEVRMGIRGDFHHPAGAAHGAAYFKVLDDATFFAANSLTGYFVLTTSLAIHLLRPISSGTLRAVGATVHASKRRWLAEGIAYDEHDQIVARACATFAISRRRIEELADSSTPIRTR